MLAGSAFKDPSVVRTLAAATPILVSDEDPDYAEAAARYAIRGYPTVVFAKPDGTEVERVLGPAPPADFLAVAERALR